MFCQYHIIFYAGCSHVASHVAGHKLPNCRETQGWTVEYNNDKCSNCISQDISSKNTKLVPPSDNRVHEDEALTRHLETCHLQVPKVNWVKLDARLAETLEQTFLRVPKDNCLKRDAEMAILLYLKPYGVGILNAEQTVNTEDHDLLSDEER